MAEQHHATPRQWLAMEVDSQNFAAASTILELRDRIEALEDAQPAKSSHQAKPDGSLVERVAAAITGDSDEPINWKPEARAAILEVAAWLREHFLQGFDPHSAGGWAMRLEQEAER